MSDRYVSPYDKPEGLVRELLEILIEECAEVQKACTKALRFGLDNGYPGSETTNAEEISIELGDVEAVVERLEYLQTLNPTDRRLAVRAKHKKLDKYLQYDE